MSGYLPLTGGTLTGALGGTSATFSGNVTASNYFSTSATTGYAYSYYDNTGASMYMGIERSTGGGLFTGSSAYATVFGSANSTNLQFGTKGIIRLTLDTTGNVGIGTTAPLGNLDVASLTPSLYIRNLSNGSVTSGQTNGELDFYSDDASGVGAHIVSSIKSVHDGVSVTAPAGALTFSTAIQAVNEVERMRITSGGNLLIGTTTDDGTKINVVGGAIRVKNVDGDIGLDFQENGSAAFIRQRNNRPLVLYTNNAEAMRIHANGNVGIGTGFTDAGYKLDVVGTGRFSDTLSTIKSGNALLKVHASTNTTPVADIELMRGTGTTWGTDAYGDYRFRDSLGNLIIQYGESGVPTPRLTITSAGNVLIGTTTDAGYKLDVNGEGRFTGTLAGLTASSTLYAPLSEAARFPTASQIYLNNSNAAANSFSGISFQLTRPSGTNTNAYIGAISTTVNPEIVFGQRDGGNNLYAERMRITSGGNVLIGTTTDAGYKLDVNGTGKFVGASASPLLDLTNSTGGTKADFTITENTGLIINSYEGASARSIDLRVGGTSALSIASTGAATFSSSVTATGGTASYSTSALPTATISTTTTGAINAAYTSIRIGARGQSGQDQSIAITNVPTADGNSAIAFTTMDSYSYAERMRITSGGNVGIGVTPSAWYVSEGYRALQVGNASLFGRNSTNSELYLSSNTFENSSGNPTYITSDFATRYYQNDGLHVWLTAPSGTAGNAISFTQAMTLNASGNVLIGTTTDNASKLQVAGNLSLTTAGNKLLIATGTNASVGLSTLVGGTVTVSTTAVTSNSGIMLTCRTVGGTQGLLRISAITGGTSFVITSSSALDTSQIAWLIIN